MQRTANPRILLTHAIRDALSGREPDDTGFEELAADWRSLSQTEKSALLQLQNWAHDGPLRAQFAQHAEYSERRLSGLLLELEP